MILAKAIHAMRDERNLSVGEHFFNFCNLLVRRIHGKVFAKHLHEVNAHPLQVANRFANIEVS